MDLKEFIEQMFRESPIQAIATASKLIELEAIENWMRVMWGVELEIKVKPAEQKDGRFYGKGLIEAVHQHK
jgi:hypothetical protein